MYDINCKGTFYFFNIIGLLKDPGGMSMFQD